jgi:hypothetical protein
MTKKSKLIDCFVCDDVRQEISGKTTFIGVYGTDVIVPMVPFMVPGIYIVSKWDISTGSFNDVTFRLETPDKNQLGPIKTTAPKDVKGTKLMMHLGLIPFQIQVAGVYKVYIKIDEEPEKTITEFEIKLAAPMPPINSQN